VSHRDPRIVFVPGVNDKTHIPHPVKTIETSRHFKLLGAITIFKNMKSSSMGFG
jgi:hypothetical protein